MPAKDPELTIVERAQNFRWNFEELERNTLKESSDFVEFATTFETLKDEAVAFSSSNTAKNMSRSELLLKIFSKMYSCVKPSIFVQICQPSLGRRVYEACLFTTLCTFLHSSKRIRGKSLKDFVLHNHPLGFDDKESPNYRTTLWDDESDKLRQFRHRLFSTREVYIKDTQWTAITKDSEHEWTFFYDIDNESDPVKDTFKRIKNLYTDIYKAFGTAIDSGYEARLISAYKKFMSKLSKIKYENYLELQKSILSHICKDEEFRGINIYGLEKELRPYITIQEVKRLSICQSPDEEQHILTQFTILKDICFPKVYESLAQLPLDPMMECAGAFSVFLPYVNFLGCLIIDELIEMNVFGDDWGSSFLKTINGMAENVFYNPSELDFTTTPKSQKSFIDFISAPINCMLYGKPLVSHK